jgi:membrane-associated protein
MAVVLGRWVAALRALVPGIAGMSGMHVTPFTTANIAGGVVWATAMAVAGYLAGASFRLLEHRLGVAGEIVLGLIVVVLVLLAIRHRIRESRAA